MGDLVVLGLLVLGIVVLTPLADRVGVPQPVLLTLYGLLVGLVPLVPVPQVDAELILPLVLPPLLFAATQNTSLTELRSAAKPVLGLAVGLTTITAALVAVVAHALGLGWAVAATLGAVVSPPDPVAATAVASRLHLPARIVTILEGEGQFNDATALVLYQLSVMALVAGGVTIAQVGVGLVVAVVGGALIGLAGGWLALQAISRLHDAATETTVTVAMPFAVYVIADRFEASGVLAVLVAGLLLRARSTTRTTSAGWLLGRAVWQYVDFAVGGLVFGFLGVELVDALEADSQVGDARTWVLTAAVVVVLVVVRAAAMFSASGIAGRRARRQGSATPSGWRESTVVSWAGMRGVVTVATTLALPLVADDGSAIPDRETVLVVALVVVLVTLVLQGLTLSPLIQRLGVSEEIDPAREVRDLQHDAAQAALDRLERDRDDDPRGDHVPLPVRETVERQYRYRLEYRAQVQGLVDGDDSDGSPGDGGEGRGRVDGATADRHLRDLLARAAEAERDAVLDARRHGRVSLAAADEVLFDIEARALRYTG